MKIKDYSFLILLVLAFMTQLLGCSDEPEVSTAVISGRVTAMPVGTEPIAGVTVTLLPAGTSKTTNSDGYYSFSDIQPGNYSIQFAKDGFQTENRSITLVVGDNKQIDIQMKKVEEKAEITLEPSSLNFGTMITEQNVVIKNNGNTTAEWTLVYGNYNWLSVSQTSGSIKSGRTQSITFSVDRKYLSEPMSVIANLQAYGNSYPITISCAPKNSVSEMVIEPENLDFGKTDSQMSFTIKNFGNAPLHWSASHVPEEISLSANNGEIAPSGSKVVIAYLDREKFVGSLTERLIISDIVSEQVIAITAVNETKPSLLISPITLEFGTSSTQQTFTMQNLGKQSISWTARDLPSAVTLSTTSGNIEPGVSLVVTATLDRSKLSGNLDSAFIISEGSNEYPVRVTAEKESQGNNPGGEEELAVVTFPATDILQTSAKLRGSVQMRGTAKIMEYGFYYGTSPSNVSTKKVVKSYNYSELLPGDYSAVISDLKAEKTYYFKAYAIDSFNDVYYGETLSFETIGTGNVAILLTSAKIGKQSVNEYILKAKATIEPDGRKITEAGFIYRMDNYDLSYDGSYATVYRVECDVVDNQISCTETYKKSGGGGIYIRAYVVLDNGLIVYNGPKTYISPDMPWPRE